MTGTRKPSIRFPDVAPKIYYTEHRFDMPTAYVDGSCKGKKRVGCGAVFYDGTEMRVFSHKLKTCPVHEKSLAAELVAAAMVVKYCLAQGYTEIKLCYDCKSIKQNAIKEPKKQTELLTTYYQFMQEAMSRMTIHFEWVKGHGIDEHNCKADYFARCAA